MDLRGGWLALRLRALLLATVVVAAGCHDHLYDFGVAVIPKDGGVSTGGRIDAGMPQTGGRTGSGGLPMDAGIGGAGGIAGSGGQAGSSSTGGTDGGISLCNPNSPALQTDPANCGMCFHQCIVPNAQPSCVAGKCQFTCQTGFYDADNNPANGCECIKTNNGVETCDGIDNDCNGIVDDGFDMMGDVNNCGSCNHGCEYPFATASCVNGMCQQGPCLPDFYDRDPNVPGCETQCIKTNGGVEICDGLDNDCDGIADDHLAAATITCLSKGVCAGTQPTCTGASGWVCTYPSTYEPIEDTKFGCDALDNDCNGKTDEPFLIGSTCAVGSGACAGTGTWVCDNASPGNHKCMGSMKQPQPEICDGIDNDCDTIVDNLTATSTDELVYVAASNVTIFKYEASRHDANASTSGFDSTGRGCSLPTRLPWTNVTATEAEAACKAVGTGWHLCVATDWENICKGGSTSSNLFPYAGAYQKDICNGYDYTLDNSLPPAPVATKTLAGCVSPSGVYDMSGNVKEWTATDLTSTSGSCTTPPCVFQLRGGAYDIASFTDSTKSPAVTIAPGLQCNASVAAPTTPVRLPSVGFRCCYAGQFKP